MFLKTKLLSKISVTFETFEHNFLIRAIGQFLGNGSFFWEDKCHPRPVSGPGYIYSHLGISVIGCVTSWLLISAAGVGD